MVLVAAHRPEDLPQAHEILNFMNERVQIPVVLGLTHLDRPGACSPEEVLLRLGYTDEATRPPAIAVDATSKASVNMALNVMLLALLMSRNQAGPRSGMTNPIRQRVPKQKVELTLSYSTARQY
jgi:hypothetical protein